MAEIDDWRVNATNNNDQPPDGFPENMDYADVNNAAREVMAVLARSYRDRNGSITSVGTNDITLTTNATYPDYFQGLNIAFRAANSNTGPMTIQLNALPAVSFVNTAGGPMQSSSIVQGLVYFAVFNGTQFQLISNGFTFPGGNPGLFSAALPTVTPALDDRIPLTDTSDNSTPKFADVQEFLQLTSALFLASDPAAVPEALDRLSFQDQSDNNNPKTATINQVLAAGNILFRSTDSSATIALGDLLSFQDVSDGNAARTANVQSLVTLLSGDRINAVNLRILTASGNYDKPVNLVSALVVAVGGGGGGGAARGTDPGGALPSNVVAAGSGGQAGATAIRLYADADLGSTTAYTIGTAGTGGVVTGTGFGVTGGTTTFSSSSNPLSCEGGRGGTLNSIFTQGSGTAGFVRSGSSSSALTAVATGGQINLNGASGQGGFVSTTPDVLGGSGGNTLFGVGGANSRPTDVLLSPTDPGENATGFGAGGGAASAYSSSAAGGDGTPGAIIILEFTAS